MMQVVCVCACEFLFSAHHRLHLTGSGQAAAMLHLFRVLQDSYDDAKLLSQL